MNTSKQKTKRHIAILTAGLFLLALLVRLPALNVFWTTDETKWVVRSHYFLSGLLDQTYKCQPVKQGRQIETYGLGCTFQTVHPGVITMWTGSAGIFLNYLQSNADGNLSFQDYLTALPVDPVTANLIAPVRLLTVFITALFTAFFFILAAQLLNWRVAFVAALLLALDPFHIALSRVLHHDALATGFMTLSLLMTLGYWQKGWSKKWLIASGIMAGLAILSKILAIFLLPFTALCGLFTLFWLRQYKDPAAWRRLIGEGLLWGLSAGIIFILLFPAMWTIPQEVITRLFLTVSDIAAKGHDQFFLGTRSKDPGWLFYPVTIFLRLSPLVVLGLGASLFATVKNWRVIKKSSEHPKPSSAVGIWIMLAVYILLFLFFLSFPSKKITRYALPLFPTLSLLSGAGLLYLLDYLILRFTKQRLKYWSVGLVSGIILLVQGSFIINNYPYYTTYYSPLTGGTVGASKLVTLIGWGEGQDQAADYFNQKPNASNLQVANADHDTFAPFFKGITKDYSYTNGNVMSPDYVVISLRQVQDERINAAFWYYLQHHAAPEHRITLHGVDYLLIYPLPVQNDVRWKDNLIEDKVTFFGYNIEDDGLRLFWQNDGLPAEAHWHFALQSVAGGKIYWQACALDPAFAPERETDEAILESLCPFPSQTPSPGIYHLKLGVGPDQKTIETLPFPEGDKALQVGPSGHISKL